MAEAIMNEQSRELQSLAAEYNFNIDRTKAIEVMYDHNLAYSSLNYLSTTCSDVESFTDQFSDKHIDHISACLQQSQCDALITQIDENLNGMNDFEKIDGFLDNIFNEAMTKKIENYFSSHFSIFWYNFQRLDTTQIGNDVSSKWHCDAGPSKHLKLIVYLNGVDKQDSRTEFLSLETTEALKSVGYIYCDMGQRIDDLSALTARLKSAYSPFSFDLNAGDAVLFNPQKVAHRGKHPSVGKKRYAIHFCIVPSPFSWRESLRQLNPLYACQPFENWAFNVLSKADEIATNSDIIEINSDSSFSSFAQLSYCLESIFLNDKVYCDQIAAQIKHIDPTLTSVNSTTALISLMKNSFVQSIPWNDNKACLGPENTLRVHQLAVFEDEFKKNNTLFATFGKVEGVTGVDVPSIDESGVITVENKNSEALKICVMGAYAKPLQEAVALSELSGNVSNKETKVTTSVIEDIESTAQLNQLSEKSFASASQRLVTYKRTSSSFYTDPYRINANYPSVRCYEFAREHYLNSAKTELIKADYVLFTLGRNDYWRFKDGSVLGMTPQPGLLEYVNYCSLDVEDNVSNVVSSFSAIRQYNPNVKLLLAIAPYEKEQNTSGLEENASSYCLGHSVLRLAVDKLVRENEFIEYIPSFDQITQKVFDSKEQAIGGRDLAFISITAELLREHLIKRDEEI
jgi:hypothetical protein